MTMANNLPYISEYYKPTCAQENLISAIQEFDATQLETALTLVSKIKVILVESILKVHAVIIDHEFEGFLNNANLNNNHCERSFGMLDYINRTRSSVKFILKETREMAKMNNFFASYNRKTKEDQKR